MIFEDAETTRPSRRVGDLMIRKARPESINVHGLHVSFVCSLCFASIIFVTMRC